MKILFLNEYAPPHLVSGAEYSMMALAEALNDAGVGVKVLSPDLSSGPTRTVPVGIKFPFWKKISPGKILSPIWFNNPFFWIYSAYWIIKTINQQQIDLLHVHGKYILPGAIIAGWLTNRPVVTTARDFKFLCPLALCFTHQQPTCKFNYYFNNEIPEYQQRYGFVSRFKLILAKLWQYQLKWFLNRSGQVIAVSPQLAKIYQDNGVKKTISIYNLPSERQLAGKNKKHIILSIGKLSYGKGTDTLIEAAKLLPQYQFIFCGEINPSFKTKFSKNCRYLGKLNHTEVLQQYAKASVFAILSRWPEPLSRAGLEALSFGLPIVASDRGGNQELVKDNGYLVDPEKPNEIASQIIKAINNQRLFSQKSLDLLHSRFNRRQILQKHLKLYQKFL